ncbi:MAG TPA: tape measure protein [Ktedonosporobacter sp.]|nr:tape measure protein [Ktedonosporobacter sp.]
MAGAGGGNVQAISAQFSADVSDFVSALSSAMSAAKAMQSSAGDLSSALTQTTPAAQGAAQGAAAAGSAVQSSGSAFSSAVSGIGNFIGAAVNAGQAAMAVGQTIIDGALSFKNFAQSASDTINSLFDLNEATETASVAFKYLTGSSSAASDEMKALSDFAANTPWPTDQIRALGEHMLAMGMNAQDVIPRMKAVGDAVAAMGGGVPQIGAVIAELQKMTDQGKITQRQMDVLIQQGFPAWQALAAGMGTSVDQAMAKVRSGTMDTKQAIDDMLSGAESKFSGAMQDQMNTMTGQLNKFKDNWNEMWQSLSGGAFAAVEAVMGGVNQILEQAILPGLKDINDEAQKVADDIKDWATNTKDGQQAVSDLNEAFKALIATVKFLLDGVAGIIMILHDIGPVLKAAFDVIMLPTQLLFQAIDGIKQLTGQTQDLSAANKDAATSSQNLGSSVSSTAGSASTAASSSSQAASSISSMGSAASTASGHVQTAASYVDNAGTSFRQLGTNLLQTTTSASSFSVTASDVSTHAKAAAASLDSTGKSAGTLSDNFRDASQASVYFQGQLDKAALSSRSLNQQLEDAGKGIGTLKAHFTDLAGNDVHWKINDEMKNTQDNAHSLQNVLLNLQDIMNALGSAMQSISGPRISSIPQAASGVENFEGGLIQVHKDEILSLPRGSSVYPVTGGPQLAPISLSNAGRGTGGSSNLYFNIDGRTFASAMGVYLTEELRLQLGVMS